MKRSMKTIKKIGILAVSLLLLIALLGVMIFRYEQFEKYDGINRYIDRWTGIEWVKVKHAAGEDRLPAKYYQNSDAAAIPEEEIVADLVRIADTEHALIIVWWGLLFLCIGGAAMALIKRDTFAKDYIK